MTAPPVTGFCYNFAMSEHTSDGVAFRIGHQIDPILPLKNDYFRSCSATSTIILAIFGYFLARTKFSKLPKMA